MKVLLLLIGLMNAAIAFTQENVGVTEVAPHVLVFATSTGNVVASVGDDGALLVGTPSAASTHKSVAFWLAGPRILCAMW
jgi:hypothetical protein